MKGRYLTLVGTALTLALSSSVAVAQSSKFPELQKQNQEETTASQDRELPPDVMEILCKNFPLNSRCQGGGGAATPVAPSSTETPVDTEEDLGGSPNPDLAPTPEFNEDTTAPVPNNSTEELLVPAPSSEPINPAPDSMETPTNPMETTPGSESELPSQSPESLDDGTSNQEVAPLTVPGGSNEEINPSSPSPTNINPANPDQLDGSSETEQNQEVSEPESLKVPGDEVKPEDSLNQSETEPKPAVPGATTNPQEEMNKPEQEPVPGAEQLKLPSEANPEVQEQQSVPSGM